MGAAWLVGTKRWVVLGTLSAVAFGGTDASASAVASLQGFRPVKSGSEVFVVLRGKPGEPSIQKTPSGVQLILPHTRMNHPFRSLETRYFATPVKLVSALRRQNDLVIDVALKDDAVKAQLEPKLDVRRKGGVLLVALEFPPGEPDQTPPPLPKVKGAKGEGDAAAAATRPMQNPNPLALSANPGTKATSGGKGKPAKAADDTEPAQPKDTPMEACQRKCGRFLAQTPPDEVAHEACNRKCESDHPIRGAKTVFPAR